MIPIQLKLNGEQRSVMVTPQDSLLDMLRDRFGLKSPKCGCDRGDCGACTVLLNGQSVRSCIILAIETDGQEIETVEGLCKEGMTVIQQKLVEYNAFQCGFCAPGMIMATEDLLRHNPNPSKDEIQESLSGNLCRCTGYAPIIDAIHDATHPTKE